VNFARIKPVKIHIYSRELHVDVLRVVGYRAECECGWSSGTLSSVALARINLAEHRAEGCSPASCQC
jgi:hypothetical protein